MVGVMGDILIRGVPPQIYRKVEYLAESENVSVDEMARRLILERWEAIKKERKEQKRRK